MSTLRHYMRLAQGPAAVLTLAKACELIPISDPEVRRDLEEAGLVRLYLGRKVVVWADVLAHISGEPAPPESKRRFPRATPLPKRVVV